LGGYERKVSSHLHPPPQVREHTDGIERIDSTRTLLTNSTATVIPKVERPGHTQWDLFHFARLGRRRRRVCAGCAPPLSCVLGDLGLGTSLGFC